MLAKRFGVGVGIAILLPMLVHYGVSTFCPSPKWKDYYQYDYSSAKDKTPEQKAAAQKERKEKREVFDARRKTFEQKLFYVATPVGIAAIIVGSYLAVQAVGAGLIFGGIFTLIDGYCWYWSQLDDWMRFVSLLIAFVVLVVIGYRKLSKEENKK